MTSLRWSYGKVEFRYEFCQSVPLPVILTNHNQHGSGGINHTIPPLSYLPGLQRYQSAVLLSVFVYIYGRLSFSHSGVASTQTLATACTGDARWTEHQTWLRI